MNKKSAAAGAGGHGPEGEERFDQVLTRLEQLVGSLERGDLPLEEALKAFEEGVGLVRKGQERLQQMERRVEVLAADGRTRPLTAESRTGQSAGTGDAKAPPADDDDIPY